MIYPKTDPEKLLGGCKVIELEKKILLTRDQYTYLLNLFGDNKPIVKQVNYYFDTDDLSMNKQNITCRIRLKDGKYRGTVKRHTSNSDYSTEVEVDVHNGVYDNTFTDMGLKLQGELITERCVILRNHVCEVVLDKNEYLGHTDYELEVEYLSEHEKGALAVLKTIAHTLVHNFSTLTLEGITMCCQNTRSKSKRFFERMKKSDFST